MPGDNSKHKQLIEVNRFIGPLSCCDSELTSETMNPFKYLMGLLVWEIGP